jgi:ElaB/YqjD/DUF883 family membrane-anchored ribosome-binding protein
VVECLRVFNHAGFFLLRSFSMIAIKKHNAEAKDVSGDDFAARFGALKSSFTQLHEDMTQLLGNVVSAGKSGAGMVKDHASTAVGDIKDRLTEIKDRGVESVERVEQKIGRNPLVSAAIAVGVGFLLARLLIRR